MGRGEKGLEGEGGDRRGREREKCNGWFFWAASSKTFVLLKEK